MSRDRGKNPRTRFDVIPRAVDAAWLVLFLGWWLADGGAATVRADYANSFESADRSWRQAETDCVVRVLVHERTFTAAHSGHASEYLRLSAGQGTYVHFVHPVEQARVIAEWRPSIWIRSDRTGLQFMVRAVLPRSVDARTGAPLTALLRGDIYERAGAWQQLTVPRPDQALERQVRVLRSQFGPQVDARDAYVDLAVLNAYGAAGTTNLWIDDLEMIGHVPTMRFASQHRDEPQALDAGGGEAGPSSPGRIRLQGSVILADGRPLFVRALEHTGEPLDLVKSLGFNAVWLRSAPTEIQLGEAQRLGVWLVAPPPNDGGIGPAHDAVLAWDVGGHLADDRLELTRQWVGQLRRTDFRADRPVVCGADERLWSYSRLVNVLLLDESPLGSSLSLSEYGQWLRQRPALARPGTPLWAAVQTEWPPRLLEQWAAMGLGIPARTVPEAEQVRLVAYEALAAGARGLLFKSRTPLDGRTPDVQRRMQALRRLNLEMQVLEPWLAGGTRSPDIETGMPDVRVSLLQTERAQLLVVRSAHRGAQYTAGPAPSGAVSLVVPSAAKAPNIFQLTPSGLQSLAYRRVAGGVRITLQDIGNVALVALTSDSLAIHHLVQSLAETKVELSKLHHESAVSELESVEALHAVLATPTDPPTAAAEWLKQARSNIRHCELLLGANDHAAAHVYAERAVQNVAHVRLYHWEQAARSFPAPVASPYSVTFAALPLHWELARRLQAAPEWSDNLLAAGDFESLEHLRVAGWQNLSFCSAPTQGQVELSTETPHGGRSALKLQLWTAAGETAPAAFELPPLQIVSAPVTVRQGQLIRVHGWARVAPASGADTGGLLICDSFGGVRLAERIGGTNGWREFVLYRAAPQDGGMTVTFALTGLGQAWLDDVSIMAHVPVSQEAGSRPAEQARRLPPVRSWVR